MHHPILLTKTTSSHGTSASTWPNDNKATGACFHGLLASHRPATLILARRIAVALLLLSAGMVIVQPCAGQSGNWTETGSLATGRWFHTATLPANGKVLVAGGGNSLASGKLYTNLKEIKMNVGRGLVNDDNFRDDITVDGKVNHGDTTLEKSKLN
jgi:hypothetical protein